MDKTNKTFFKTIEGTEVFLREDGKFEAKIAGRTVTKRALSDIEKELQKAGGALTVYEISMYGDQETRKVEIIGFDRKSGKARYKDGRFSNRSDRFYIIDEEDLGTLRALKKQIEALESIWTEKIDSLEEVTERNFSELRSRRSAVK